MEQSHFKQILAELDKLSEDANTKDLMQKISSLLSEDLTDEQRLFLHNSRGNIYLSKYNDGKVENDTNSGINALNDFFNAYKLSVITGGTKTADNIILEKISGIMTPIIIIALLHETLFKETTRQAKNIAQQGGSFPSLTSDTQLSSKSFLIELRKNPELDGLYQKIYSRMLHRIQTGVVSTSNITAFRQDVITILGDEFRLKYYSKSGILWIFAIVIIVGLIMALI